MGDDGTLLGLDMAGCAGKHRFGRRSLSSGGTIYHLNARTGLRSSGQSPRTRAAYRKRARR